MWYFYGQRRREEFKKALEGALKFFPGIKRTPEQELCFQSRVVKRKMFSEYGKASYMSEYWFHKTLRKKAISVPQISNF